MIAVSGQLSLGYAEEVLLRRIAKGYDVLTN